ncbi:MAG: dimethyl sulfoxide reductase anchor subunit [Anaerolineales bacterium]|nr:dimethyl sulfoxide reductase anchor subunit [Anaerolineales bacterium]
MNVREWALIIFTILAQMSVGAFWVLRIVHVYATRKAGAEEADRMNDRALLAIIPVLTLGMLASLLHLGSPFSAYKAVSNLGTSWLSREVLFGVLFLISGALFAFLQWKKIGSIALRNALGWAAALIGIGLVYSMSSIYMLFSQPSWNTWVTPISFFVTTILLGSLAMGAAYVWNYAKVQKEQPDCVAVQCELMRTTLRGIAITSVVLLGIELVVFPIYLGYLALGNAATIASLNIMISNFTFVFVLRLILVFVGAGLFGMFLYQNTSPDGKERTFGNVAYIAFVLVLASEIMGRFLFYISQQNIGL